MKTNVKQLRNQRGLAILTFAMASAALVPLFGTAMDAAMLCVVKQQLSAAVDSAAHHRSTTPKAVERFVNANFPEGHLGTSNRRLNLERDRLEVSVDAPTYFLQLIHVSSVRVVAAAKMEKGEPKPAP